MNGKLYEINIKLALVGMVFVLIVLYELKMEFEIPYHFVLIFYLYIQVWIFLFCKKNIALKMAGIFLVPLVILQLLMPANYRTRISKIDNKIT